jgi:cephalosporin hydroxylase
MNKSIKAVTGCTEYKGYTVQQHENVFGVFRSFLAEIRPARILEIGTAGGGLTLYMREVLDELGLQDSPIKSFDVYECPWYATLRTYNIEINIHNMFDHAYMNLIEPELIVPYIQQDGLTLVLCDGGHKIAEFNQIAPHIKVGDFIMAHDYIDTWDTYLNKFKGKIWDWCEVEEKYLEPISTEHNLVHYNKETFDEVVWVCKTKTH